MNTEEKHPNDLIDFINTSIKELEEYNRIQKHVKEDPGTGGDEGEENWAKLLRDWLPWHYHVKTKGRILNSKGKTSKQVDVIVLHPSYPKKLLDNNSKLYLSGGVVAAFECKLTLKKEHIENAVKCGIQLKHLVPRKGGTPYRELNSPIIYGLLAHSHSWKGQKSRPIKNVEKHLVNCDRANVKHPREMMDILCVSDLANWNAYKNIHLSSLKNLKISEKRKEKFIKEQRKMLGENGTIHSVYGCYSKEHPAQQKHFTPIGSMLTYLLKRIAWENTDLRNIADHFFYSSLEGCGGGQIRLWSPSILNRETRKQVLLKGNVYEHWNEWKTIDCF